MKYMLFFTSLFLVTIGHLLRVKRFKIIIDEKNISEKDVYNSLAIGYIFNVILPIRLGELVRAIAVSRFNQKKFTIAVAGIIIERIFDGMFIIIAVSILYIYSQENETTFSNIFAPYFLIILMFFLALGLLVSAPNFMKKKLFKILDTFPDTANIHLYRLIFKIVNILKMVLQAKTIIKLVIFSLTMWVFYFSAYIFLAASLNQVGIEGLLTILNYLFTFTFVDKEHTAILTGIIPTIFLLLPPIFILLWSQLKSKRSFNFEVFDFKENEINGLYFSNVKIEHHFYESYFKSQNRGFYTNYKQIFENCEILKDESGTSGAVTSIIRNEKGKFYRKYAFGETLEALKNQLNFLRTTNLDNFVNIEAFKITNSIVSFDMIYKEHCLPISKACEFIEDEKLFNIIQSIYSEVVLQSNDINHTSKDILEFIKDKVFKNVELSFEYYESINIDVYTPIIVNEIKYSSVREILTSFKNLDFEKIFNKDTKVHFHGDLTLENIIWDPSSQLKYYFIDPNPSSKFNSLESEIAKLYQSLEYNYENYKFAEYIEISKNNIFFISKYSDKYLRMKSHLDKILSRNLPESSILSVKLHAIVHLLRILPYVKNDKTKKEFILMQLILGIQHLKLIQ
jgi:hypothetical protein